MPTRLTAALLHCVRLGGRLGVQRLLLLPLRENHMTKIDDMRDWLKDCVWADMDSADVNDLSDSAILRGINRHYDGGVDQFRADAGEAR